jgi:hypothetical protein
MSKSRLSSLEGSSRRQFLRWSAAAAAVLALDRAKVLEVVADSAGVAMADEAAGAATNRSVHLVAGNGSFAWFQLLWPHVAVATSSDDAFAFHAKGLATKATDTDKSFYFAPESPWQELGSSKRISAFMAGHDETHTYNPSSATNLGFGANLLAMIATIQRDTPSLVPVIAVEPVSFGAPTGPWPVATVPDAAGLVQLFASTAPSATLAVPGDGALFDAYYKTFLSLDAAAGRPTWARSVRTGKFSARLAGKNLEQLLEPSAADLLRYGIEATTPDELVAMARSLITTAKAFGLGLTQTVILPVLGDDPHTAFEDMNQLQATVRSLGRILDAFMNDLGAMPDPLCSSRSIADGTVLTVHGDTPKNPLQKAGWPDETPGNTNWLYAMGNGYLRTGWFGGVKADGTLCGFDPATGAEVADQPSDATSRAASLAVAYAVAKGDTAWIRDFLPLVEGGIGGIVV